MPLNKGITDEHEKLMIDMYQQAHMSIREIAKAMNLSYSTVHYYLEKHEIKFRAQGFSKHPFDTRCSYQEIEIIRYLYHEKKLSLREISDILDMSAGSVSNRMKYAGIPKRERSENSKVTWKKKRDSNFSIDTISVRIKKEEEDKLEAFEKLMEAA